MVKFRVADVHPEPTQNGVRYSGVTQNLKNSGLVLDRRDGFPIHCRLAEPTRGTRKHLFDFLHQAFKDEEPFGEDIRKLKGAIQHGGCTQTEWRLCAALRLKQGAVTNV